MDQHAQPPSPPGAPDITFEDETLFDDDGDGFDDLSYPGLKLQPFEASSLNPDVNVTATRPVSRPSSAHSGDHPPRRTTWPSGLAEEIAKVTYFPFPESGSGTSRQEEEESTLSSVDRRRFLSNAERAQTLGGPIASQTTAEEPHNPSAIDIIQSSANLPKFPTVGITYKYNGETQEHFNSRANLAAVQTKSLTDLKLAITSNYWALEFFANQPDLQLTGAQNFGLKSANSIIEVDGLPKDDVTKEWVEYWDTQKAKLREHRYELGQ
ncbi:hypothetical protein I302_108409 [Kwoniella bestiolae CBS 10118]|uniref:Uncharacterized protein n=1 Tax=Kwoniella bestiolae CBS 10118 TaxID=1296100 RepID=A0A1B9FVR9_9TREE|nr:hypothetical protein I302_07216 [Kwoniella bestiolae CBS 10118]OCF22869.1 hypothetical protein I302_07216 [Kwoniella bestiolae CBS 10118]